MSCNAQPNAKSPKANHTSALTKTLELTSGIYDDYFFLGYNDSSRKLSGYIDYQPYQKVSGSIQIGCRFYIIGIPGLQANSFNLTVYFNTDSSVKRKGTLKVQKDKVYLKIDDIVPSCSSVMDFTGDKGAMFTLSEPRKFFDLGMVEKEKTFIYNKSGNTIEKLKKYLVKGDYVNILQEEEGWLLIEFIGKKVSRGWIKKEDILMP